MSREDFDLTADMPPEEFEDWRARQHVDLIDRNLARGIPRPAEEEPSAVNGTVLLLMGAGFGVAALGIGVGADWLRAIAREALQWLAN